MPTPPPHGPSMKLAFRGQDVAPDAPDAVRFLAAKESRTRSACPSWSHRELLEKVLPGHGSN